MANMLGCSLEVSEFELQTQYYVHFWINTLVMNLFILPLAMSQIASQMFFYNYSFGTK